VPLVAIQLSAMKIGEQIVLNFVTVLNRVALRHDDEVELPGSTVDREYWNQKSKPAIIAIADELLKKINAKVKTPFHPNYLKHYIGLTDGTKSRNFVYFYPRKQYTYVNAKTPDAQKLATALEDKGMEAGVNKENGYLWVLVHPQDVKDNELLTDAVIQAVASQEEA
jgi:hypothetical protein